ncbi:MAG: Cna B-type domain-containing protein [Clostridiales bacterium]|nr:Cna B-type domain-containing protein [Clostridiales bacterium]MDY6116596.1 Cna B-type domain-containing protein [Anaerovoracaceae bacterium]
MKSSVKKVLTCILTALVIITTALPTCSLAYSDENINRTNKTVETTEPLSTPEGKPNNDIVLENNERTISEDSIQNQREKSPQKKLALNVPKKISVPAKAPGESTGKVELKISRLVENKLEVMPTDWYTQQVVNSVVDLDVSGNNYAIENPYLLLRLPKTDKIMDVKFVDSAAGKTERYEDENYQYIKYTYTRLTGGTHYTYQYYFTFDGHHAKNGDSIEAQAQLFDGNDTLVKEVKQTYTAKTVGFELWSTHGNSGMYNIKKTVNNDGHDYEVWGYIDKAGDTKTIARDGNRTNVFAAVYPKKIDGINESVGIEYPKNLKIVYTYQEDEPGFREFSPDGKGYHSVNGLKGKYTWKQDKNVYTFLIPNPTFDTMRNGVPGATNGRYATYANSVMKDNGVTVNKKLPIRIDYYKNANEDGTGGELLGTRYENFTFIPYAFPGGSTFSYDKRSFKSYNIADEFNYIYHPEYYHLNSKLYKGNFNMADKGGIPLTTFISNWNKGSSYSNPYEGGKTDKVTEVYTKLLTNATYFKSVQLRAIISNGQNTNNDKHKAAIKSAINTGNTKLYGIDKDGNDRLIKENIKLDELVKIEDSSRNYVELVVRFQNPVELDNMTLQLRERQWFVSSELDALRKLEDGMHTYESECAVTRLDDSNNPVKGKYVGFLGKPTYFTVTPLHPTVDSYISKPQVVQYKEDATFDYLVGPELPRIAHDNNVPYGELEELKNVKTITLLPSGYEYAGKYEKEMHDSNWNSIKIADPTITTVENYQGSGKTAVIVDYGTIKKSTHYPIKLKLRATKYAARGESDFVNYMTYDDNDFIRPLPASDNANDYVDALDLDQDGDTTEIFMQKHTTVTFVPPMELIIKNAVKHDVEFQQEVTGDLGYDITQKINIFNNSIKDIDTLSIIDVLPHKDDHSISPNEKGEYPNRQSTFAMPLTKSLEDANNQTVNDKVSFFYQLTDQGSDLASVRDGQWLTADQVKDFSEVRSVKIVLKDGQALKSKEELNILLPSKITGDTSLDEENDVAVNSSAFCTDGTSYTEGNITKVRFTKYKVTGIAFLDIDKDGKYDPNKGDILQKDFKVNVLNKDGSQAKDFNDKDITGITNGKGEYSIPVYKRGEYMISFVKDGNYNFSKKSEGEEAVANSIDTESIKDNTANTKGFALNPAHKSQINNVALETNYASIKIIKTSKNEKTKDGNLKKLEGVEFNLQTKNGKSVKNYKGEVIKNIVTDKNGEAVFKLVPYGKYIVKEVKTVDGYLLPKEDTDVTLSHNTVETDENGEKVLILKLTNKPNPKIDIAGKKVWDDANNQDGIRPGSVTIHLLANGEDTGKTAKAIKDSKWHYTFKNLPTYDAAGEKITYSVKEDVPHGYKGKIDGTTITNTHTPKLRDINVSKEWKGPEDQRKDQVTINLLADGKTTDKKLILNAENNWKGTFKDLPEYNDGKKIGYTISEEKLAGYESEITGTQEKGFVVTNTYNPKPVIVDPPVSKIVEGNPKNQTTFTFKFKALDENNPMPEGSKDGVKTTTIKGSGSSEFGNIEFKLPGTYRYEITEVNDGVKNYKYDKSVYVITFEVKDKDGELFATQSIEKKEDVNAKEGETSKAIVFKNKYEEPKKEVESPRTGDKNHPITYMALGGFFSSLLLMSLFKRRRNA